MYRKYRLVLQFHFFVSLIYTTVLAQAPLTFNPHNLKVYNLPNSLSSTPVLPYAVACPAETKAQSTMNDKDSMDHKALFINRYYGERNIPLNSIQCKEEVKLAAVYNRTNHRIEFGYEVYFEKDPSKENIQYNTSSYSHYGPVKEARSWWMRVYSERVQRSTRPLLQDSSKDKDVGFIWLPRIILKYDSSKWNVISSRYVIYSSIPEDLKMKCDDYDLGNTFYKEEHRLFDKFYSLKNQEKIFSLVELPELPENSVCKTTHECVAKYDLLMPYHFRTGFKSRVSCSNLATIPIWYEISEPLLRNLEMFLFAIHQKTGKILIILPGVSGTLEFMTKNARKPKPMTIYMYPKEKKIPIPKIIYKIIRYITHDCDTKKTLCWFDMVVVIHNHPGPIQNQMICPQDVCKDYGWESIKLVNGSQVSENIYCCELDIKMQKYLDFSVGEDLRDNFNLKEFPLHDATLGKGKHKTINLQKLIEDQLKQLQTREIQMPESKL